MEGGDEEVVSGGDGGCLKEELGLRAAFFAGDEHLGDGGRFRKRQLAVHLARKVAAQRNQEEYAHAAAGQADKYGLHRMRIEVKDVERGQSEDGAGHHAAGGRADAGDDDIFKQAGAPLVDARQSDREDGDRDGGFHPLADLQSRIC
jgi:hypothetical protein